MKAFNEAGLHRVKRTLGIGANALLGQGGEAKVYALDSERIARINRPGANLSHVNGRTALLSKLGRSAGRVPFAIPVVLETLEVEGNIVTIERRLPGRPLDHHLGVLSGESRDSLVRAYLEAASQIGDLLVERPLYGDLLGANAIHTPSFRSYLEQRAIHSLKAAGREFETVDPARLAAALPEPAGPALVHLDAFPGNMLAEDGVVTAVLDFGTSLIIGDRRLDPLTAAAYLTRAITPTATGRDRAVAQEWLIANSLADLFPAARSWIAAYWSFARDDPAVYSWCRSVLLE